MSDLPRRRLLALAGTATTATIAGCSSSDDEENGDEENEDEEESAAETEAESDVEIEGTILGEIDVENLHDESHTVDIIVEFEGEFEDWTTTKLDARSGNELDRNWPTDPGSFRVIARLDEGEPTQVTPAKWNEPDCLNLDVLVRADGLSISGDTDRGPCSEDTGADDT